MNKLKIISYAIGITIPILLVVMSSGCLEQSQEEQQSIYLECVSLHERYTNYRWENEVVVETETVKLRNTEKIIQYQNNQCQTVQQIEEERNVICYYDSTAEIYEKLGCEHAHKMLTAPAIAKIDWGIENPTCWSNIYPHDCNKEWCCRNEYTIPENKCTKVRIGTYSVNGCDEYQYTPEEYAQLKTEIVTENEKEVAFDITTKIVEQCPVGTIAKQGLCVPNNEWEVIHR